MHVFPGRSTRRKEYVSPGERRLSKRVVLSKVFLDLVEVSAVKHQAQVQACPYDCWMDPRKLNVKAAMSFVLRFGLSLRLLCSHLELITKPFEARSRLSLA